MGAAAQRKHALGEPGRHVLTNRTLKALLLPTAQAHWVREQAAAIGSFRQPMLFVSEAAIREAGVHLAAASTLSTAPSRRSAGSPPAAAAAGVEVEVPTAAAAAAAAAAAGNSSSGSEYCVVLRRWQRFDSAGRGFVGCITGAAHAAEYSPPCQLCRTQSRNLDAKSC